MKLTQILSFFGIIYFQVITVHPDSELLFFLIWLACCALFIFSSSVLIWRWFRHSNHAISSKD